MTAVVQFPVGSFREAAEHLRRPFTAEAVRFKVQATWPKNEPTNGLVVCYIDARLAVERLNMIVPHLWSDHYEPVSTNRMWCHLTVDGITRSDMGEGDGKGLVSDALKRAAVKFGVGVSLYATPKMVVAVEGGNARHRKARDGKTLELTPKGESYVRGLYARWLKAHATKAFGDPLDHGDVLGAQGDAEAGDLPPDVADSDEPALAGSADVERMVSAATGLAPEDVKMVMAACGLPGVNAYNKVPADKVEDVVARLNTVER